MGERKTSKMTVLGGNTEKIHNRHSSPEKMQQKKRAMKKLSWDTQSGIAAPEEKNLEGQTSQRAI